MTAHSPRDLLDIATDDLDGASAPDDLLARARRRRRRSRTARGIGSGVALAAVATGSLALLNGARTPHPTDLADRPAVVAWKDAPACVRDQLAYAAGRVRADHLSVVVAEIPPGKQRITQGIGAGSGWRVTRVASLVSQPGSTPGSTFLLWDGPKPTDDPRPGRTLLLVSLANVPQPPADDVGEPVWFFDVTAHFPVDGDAITVTCGDGSRTRVAWTSATGATGWLEPDAPTRLRPSGSASVPRAAETAATTR